MQSANKLHPKLHPVRIKSREKRARGINTPQWAAVDCGADGGARTHNLRFRSSFAQHATRRHTLPERITTRFPLAYHDRARHTLTVHSILNSILVGGVI